jgi:hypothetical protein
MRKLAHILLICLVFAILTACSYHEGVVQTADKSFLKFTGSVEGAVVQVDQNAPFALSAYQANPPYYTVYQISPGKHHIVIRREEVTVVEQIIYIGNGETREVVIP